MQPCAQEGSALAKGEAMADELSLREVTKGVVIDERGDVLPDDYLE
jgi:hypothetical protein